MRTVVTTAARLRSHGLRKARRDRDLSQEALADEAGLSAKHVGEIERANKDPRLTTVLKLADALELRSSELFRAVRRAARLLTPTAR